MIIQTPLRHSRPLFTSSWDDGHPLDARLAELLQLHGFKATFFVPMSNREGRPVMSGSQMRNLLGKGFEIGSHTLDHCYLTTLDDATAQNQIIQGKRQLEQTLGTQVRGFCYPGGKYADRHIKMVRAAGFEYARTTKNLHTDILQDAYEMPVGFQCYPHSSAVYLRNFVRYGDWRRRTRMLPLALYRGDLLGRLRGALDEACLRGGVFHLWGHSWEFDQFDGWRLLEEFLGYASERIPAEDRLTNFDVLLRHSHD